MTAPSVPAPPAASAEHDLRERLLHGDQAAFRGLVDRYHARLVRLALPFVSRPAVAEEVAQETWLAGLEGLHGFSGRASLKTWISTILVTRARTRGAREGRPAPFSAIGRAAPRDQARGDDRRLDDRRRLAAPSPWEEPAAERALLDKESHAVVEHVLAELPPLQRAVLLLHDLEELEAAEVCRILDLSDGNQRVLLHRARTRLRRALARYRAGDLH
jgi:RNA polymerase sigma-70 factor, ECF subfamily